MSSIIWNNPFAKGEEKMGRITENILQNSNMVIRPETGKLGGLYKSTSYNTPWIHFHHTTVRHCGIWNRVYFRSYGHIPKFCRYHCWKTVIKPTTVKELFMLHDLMQSLNWPSKCGIDVRDYTPGPYAGFVYADSLKEGQSYCRAMKKHVAEAIGDHVAVLLKRGCTEMEQAKPSDQWDDWGPNDELLERKLDDIYMKEEADGKQGYWLQNVIKRKWVRHAMSIGDETWKEITDASGMHPHVVHYDDYEAYSKTKTVENEKIATEVSNG